MDGLVLVVVGSGVRSEGAVADGRGVVGISPGKATASLGSDARELDSVDDRTKQVILPKSDLRKALNYVRNHWTELTRYLGDAELPPDNNSCEQLMRDVAVGRKNWSAPDVLSRTSGRMKAQDALLAMFETMAV